MTGKYPRLHSHSRKRKSGKVVVYYVFDRRPDGLPDVALGTDFDEAIRKWNELHHHAARIVGTLDLGSATGMRLTDCTAVLLPKTDTLHLEASKTGKEAGGT